MKKIFISGNFLSGKQTILYLLDNHKNIISNFIHDKFIKSIIDLNNKIEKNIDKKINLNTKLNSRVIEISNFRNEKTYLGFENFIESFNLSNLKHTEHFALLKIMPNSFSAINKDYLEFNFDYENFTKNLKTRIFLGDQKKFTIENIFDIYINSFIENWKNLNLQLKDINALNFATKLPNKALSAEFILKQKFDSKIIYVDRELLSILKSRTLNMMVQNQIELKNFDIYFNNQLRTNFIERVSYNKREIIKLKKNIITCTLHR